MLHGTEHWRVSGRMMAPIQLFLGGCLYCCVGSRSEEARLSWEQVFQGIHKQSPRTKATGKMSRDCVLSSLPLKSSLYHTTESQAWSRAQGKVPTQTWGRNSDGNVSVLWSSGFAQRGCSGFAQKDQLFSLTLASQVVLVVKNPPAKARHTRDEDLIPRLGRSP